MVIDIILNLKIMCLFCAALLHCYIYYIYCILVKYCVYCIYYSIHIHKDILYPFFIFLKAYVIFYMKNEVHKRKKKHIADENRKFFFHLFFFLLYVFGREKVYIFVENLKSGYT